jgi:hypothetical protein
MTDVYRRMRRLAANQFRPEGEELGSVRSWVECPASFPEERAKATTLPLTAKNAVKGRALDY